MTSHTTARARNLFFIPVVMTVGGMVMPAHAQPRQQPQSSEQSPQPTSRDDLKAAAGNVNAQRADLFKKKDAAGIAALYTSDATYIELMPRLDVMRGRTQIHRHFQELFDANANDLVVTVTTAEMTGDDTALVGGDYTLVAGQKRINGHFFQTLRRDGGTWKIALHAFARPEPVTVREADQSRGG
jgi:uncharacterized protein (TIGR02246 family)